MAHCHPVQTPMSPNITLSKSMSPQTPAEIAFMRSVPYLSDMGTLQYLATMTWSDIAQVVAYLAHFNANPGPQHWLAVKHLLSTGHIRVQVNILC
jgi:hypothetical protein